MRRGKYSAKFIMTSTGLQVIFVLLILLSTKTKFSTGRNENIKTEKKPRLIAGAPLTKDELERAARLPFTRTPPFDEDNDPMRVPGLFEGDIDGVNVTELLVKNAIINSIDRWPDGIIPYVIGAEFGREERLRIAQAIIEFHGRTCVRFVPRRNQHDFLFFYKGGGCMSQVGRKGGQQLVSLGFGCHHPGIIIHELMHAVGFWHEQSRADRDQYIKVLWENIAQGMEFNFLKFTWREIQGLGEPYDLSSVMHYGPNAFSRDGRTPTLIPFHQANMGQRDGFSAIDLSKVNKLYDCGRISGPGGGFECRDAFAECKRWASQGECTKNPLWMPVNCRLSCGMCGELQECVDRESSCGLWSFLWQCQVNPNYMLNFCRKSCRACRGTLKSNLISTTTATATSTSTTITKSSENEITRE